MTAKRRLRDKQAVCNGASAAGGAYLLLAERHKSTHAEMTALVKAHHVAAWRGIEWLAGVARRKISISSYGAMAAMTGERRRKRR